MPKNVQFKYENVKWAGNEVEMNLKWHQKMSADTSSHSIGYATISQPYSICLLTRKRLLLCCGKCLTYISGLNKLTKSNYDSKQRALLA